MQPLLLPVAAAGVLAYLLEPVVTWLARRGVPRLIAVIIVFALFITSGALLIVGIGPNIYNESVKFSTALPGYLERSWASLDDLLRQNLEKLPQIGPHTATPAASPAMTPTASPAMTPAGTDTEGVPQLRFSQDNPWVLQSLAIFERSIVWRGAENWGVLAEQPLRSVWRVRLPVRPIYGAGLSLLLS